MFTLLGYFGIGTTELLILGGIILLLFGNRLPSTMRSLGRGIVEFKKGVQGIEEEADEAASGKKASEAKTDKPAE